jgi:hypothetical protein
MAKKKLGDCVDCGRNTYELKEYYMVNDWVWMSAGMSPNGGMLCVKDLEKRLQRKLSPRDFFLCALNVLNIQKGQASALLHRRMGDVVKLLGN